MYVNECRVSFLVKHFRGGVVVHFVLRESVWLFNQLSISESIKTDFSSEFMVPRDAKYCVPLCNHETGETEITVDD